MFEKLYKEVTDWQKETFKFATAHSKAHHLKQEIDELIEAIETNSPTKHLEYADCFILLMGAANADSMEVEDVLDAISEKLQINKARKWGVPDEKGVVNHIR